MCRLALMNRQAVALLDSDLLPLLHSLEHSFGGDGNGVAALWANGAVQMRKRVDMTPEQAAWQLHTYASRGADWLLFHTRRASSAEVAHRHCHPFKRGQFVLAHNGHDATWAKLGHFLKITDSECITRLWAAGRLPLVALTECRGVFLGFKHAAPFIIKGQPHSDLVVARHEQTGAILFASELPRALKDLFDQVVQVGSLQWYGGDLDLEKLEVRPAPILLASLKQRFPSIFSGHALQNRVEFPNSDDEEMLLLEDDLEEIEWTR